MTSLKAISALTIVCGFFAVSLCILPIFEGRCQAGRQKSVEAVKKTQEEFVLQLRRFSSSSDPVLALSSINCLRELCKSKDEHLRLVASEQFLEFERASLNHLDQLIQDGKLSADCANSESSLLEAVSLVFQKTAITKEDLICLQAFQNLQSLAFLEIEEFDTEAIAWVSKLPELCSLTFEEVNLESVKFTGMKLPQLGTLFLTGSTIGDVEIQTLKFAKFPTLDGIYINETKVSDEGLELLGRFVYKFPKLRYLDVSGSLITSKSVKAFSTEYKRISVTNE